MKNVSLPEAAADPRADANPLRVALAVKIREAAKIRHAAARHKQGVERTFDAVVAAEAEHENALAGVARSQAAHVAAIAHAAASGAEPPAPSEIRRARRAVIDAEDQTESLKAALALMRADLQNWAKEVSLAETEVESAISAVLSQIAVRLIERGEQIASQLEPIRSLLNALWSEPSPPNHDQVLAHEQARKPLEAALESAAQFLRSSTAIGTRHELWANLRAQLRIDAYSELPEQLAELLSGERG
jgi:hypothetical protein